MREASMIENPTPMQAIKESKDPQPKCPHCGADLEEALGELYALVKGESPQLLEDDHHDEIVRSALHLD
jgi:hypothetical protein